MKLTFFDILSDILLKKDGTLYKNAQFQQIFSPFMLVRYLSMKESLISYANTLNMLHQHLTYKEVYLWCYHTIPKQTSGYIKYIKKSINKTKRK